MLPSDYIVFLQACNGGEGELDIEPGWMQLWKAEEVLPHNRAYETHERLPGFLAFGSSGGGEMFAFDLRKNNRGVVVMTPFIPMDAELALVIASTFTELAAHFGRRST